MNQFNYLLELPKNTVIRTLSFSDHASNVIFPCRLNIIIQSDWKLYTDYTGSNHCTALKLCTTRTIPSKKKDIKSDLQVPCIVLLCHHKTFRNHTLNQFSSTCESNKTVTDEAVRLLINFVFRFVVICASTKLWETYNPKCTN